MRKETFKYLILSLIVACITILLALTVVDQKIPLMDQRIHESLTGWGPDILHNILAIIAFTVDTEMAFIFTVITIIWLLYKYKTALYLNLLLCMNMGGGVIITYFIKTAVAKERPGEVASMNVWGLFTDKVSYSFPSGHAIKAFLLFGFIIYAAYTEIKDKKIKTYIIAFFSSLTVVIGIAQLILNRHYATDIIGGYLVGLAWFYFCLALSRPIYDLMCRYLKFLKPTQGTQGGTQGDGSPVHILKLQLKDALKRLFFNTSGKYTGRK